jgi:hypothetical protein
MPGNTAPALAAEYSGRANLVVFDFTDEASTSTSEAVVRRLGLEAAIEASLAGEPVL